MSSSNHGILQKTYETRPLLIGLLVDVSGSMNSQIKNESNDSQTRLESLKDSIDDLVIKARAYYEESEDDPSSFFQLFVYGFGFGNLLTKIQGRKVPAVKNLFALNDDEDTVLTAQELLDNWKLYRENIIKLSKDMLGATPMIEALTNAEKLIKKLTTANDYREQPMLMIVSDGLPTDPKESGAELVIQIAKRLKNNGVLIISCFVNTIDITNNRTLYSSSQKEWDEGARLMFECSSIIPPSSFFHSHLAEYNWSTPPNSKLFAQVNQSELLSEFMQLILSPLKSAVRVEETQTNIIRQEKKEVSVFVSYCHGDKKYVSEDRNSLLSFIRALEHEGVTFWWDRRMQAGDIWDAEISQHLDHADMALLLISQSFLNSRYCIDTEVKSFIEARKERGLKIIPVILSACDWFEHEWLSSTQLLPMEGKNIEEHYSKLGTRKSLYLQILKEIRLNAKKIRELKNQ